MTEFIGQENIISFFDKALRANKLAHAYLFIGPAKIGKMTLARNLAWHIQNQKKQLKFWQDKQILDRFILNCVDIFEISGQEKEISVLQIRQCLRHLALSAYQALCKISLIRGIDNISKAGANAFLKTLEEPRGHNLIILTAQDKNHVLPTIISRCQIIQFKPVLALNLEQGLKKHYAGSLAKELSAISLLAQGRPGQAIAWCEDAKAWRQAKQNLADKKQIVKASLAKRFAYAKQAVSGGPEALRREIDSWLYFWRQQQARPDLLKDFLLLKKQLRYNINKQLALESVLIKL